MPSLQNSAGAGKAAKFVAANPLDPMANPFSEQDDSATELQEKMSENINKRLTKAMDDLKEKHRTGTNEIDDEDRAPTGAAYKAHAAKVAQQRHEHSERKRLKEADETRKRLALKEEARKIFANKDRIQGNEDDDESEVDSDDEFLKDLDDDPELEAIRNSRLSQLKQAQIQKIENIAKGHGQYRTISQDEFLTECTGSEFVAAHFFHDDFERCKIMDHHLKMIAPLHTSCKFLRINAEKAPFFVAKLQVKTLPTLIVFKDGKIVDRLTGFEGLANNPKEPDKWHTGKLQQWISTTGAIKYNVPTEEIREEMRRLGLKPRGNVWSGFRGDANNDVHDDF